MSTALASDMTESVVLALLRFEKKGVFLDPQTIATLVRNLRTIREVARQMEEENTLLERQLQREKYVQKRRAEQGAAMAASENVVRFPVKVRLVPSGGGDAA